MTIKYPFKISKMLCLILVIAFLDGRIFASELCYSNMSEVLDCFLNYDDKAYQYEFVKEIEDGSGVTIKTYLLSSQKWPINKYQDIPTTTWQHKLILYIPKKILYDKALLYVTGGRNRDVDGNSELLSPLEQIDCVGIALANKALVAEVQTVPNQYLFFNGRPFKEDQIMAYTYKKVMDDPLHNAYLAGHLPMAKSVIKAMDAVQEILLNEHNFRIVEFVLSGASKRGWAVWLAAFSDNRVIAIVPIVINILNVQKSLFYICQSYGGICPPTLRDYEEYGILKMLKSEAFAQLMEIEDPYSYLYGDKYKSRVAISKYIINASGDDFFVPDSSRWYFKNLPGKNNHIRYLPNSMHYFRGNPISDSTASLRLINESLNNYFYFILHRTSLPNIDWKFSGTNIEIASSVRPQKVKLWVANNERARDFRFLGSYSGWHLFVKRVIHFFTGKMCDNCYIEHDVLFNCIEDHDCKIQVVLPPFKRGWQASFVELTYDIGGVPFVITTEVNIVPDVLPSGVPDKGDL